MKNKLALDFRDNPDLKSLLGGKQPGDRLTLEFEVMVTSVDEETFEAEIESITPDSDGEDAETVDVDTESPVSATLIKPPRTSKKTDDNSTTEDSSKAEDDNAE